MTRSPEEPSGSPESQMTNLRFPCRQHSALKGLQNSSIAPNAFDSQTVADLVNPGPCVWVPGLNWIFVFPIYMCGKMSRSYLASVTFTNWPSRRACWPGTIAKSAGLTPATISTFVPSLKPTVTSAFFALPSLKM
jgi:hypothetical protein